MYKFKISKNFCYIIIFILLMVILISIVNIYCTQNKIKLIIWDNRKKRVVSPTSKYFKQLQNECEELLTSSNDVLDLIVTKKEIDKARENLAVEVVYHNPKKVVFNNLNNLSIRIDRFLIFLKGNFSIVYLGKEKYSGAFSSGKDLEKIKYIINIIRKQESR